MFIEEEGVKKINWRWMRRLFQWEKEIVEVCSGLVLGVKRVESEGDSWKWRDDAYSVKVAYQSLIDDEEEEEEEHDWYKDVWNQLIPSNMSMLAWRLFYKMLPTKENLIKRGTSLDSSALCVGGCGGIETEDHLFFNCPTMGVVWRELVRGIGIPVVLAEGGPAHLSLWKNLVIGNSKSRDRIGAIWFSTISLIWKVRNDIIFNQAGLDWEKLLEEIKILSWRILRARSKGFNYVLSS
jgi:hypothetical protein